MSVFPEILSGRSDGFVPTGWTITEGAPIRGAASCNFTDRILQVPLGYGLGERVVRAHELAHVRMSPHCSDVGALPFDVHPRAAECAEEFRINTVLARLGFDVEELRDGSEGLSGERVALTGEWDEAVLFLLAVVGTGGERTYLSGVRRHQPEWLPALRAIAKQANALVADVPVARLASTDLTPEGQSEGYARYTVPLARMVTSALRATPPTSSDELRSFRRSLQPGARRPATGSFAPLVLAPSVEPVLRERRPLVRRRRPQTSGTSLAYPQRLLTDPYQRGFAGRRRSRGAVIVIDQSGSMDIEEKQLHQLLAIAPQALIIGYSHRPGDQGHTPNAWILATEQGVVPQPHTGNIGNGVDGPVLEWAATLRRPNDVMIWVTDGQVTDAHDHPCDTLSLACAQIVQRERIKLACSLETIGECAQGRQAPLDRFGRVGRKLLEIR